jgi:hypothetical protein
MNLRNITHKIGDLLGGVERQLNPLDHGATYANPNPAPPPAQTQAPQPSPFQRAWNQVNPLDNGRTWQNPNPVNPGSVPVQLMHSGAGHLVAPVFNMGKSLGQGAWHIAGVPIEVGRATTAHATGNIAAENAAVARANAGIDAGIGIARALPVAAYQLGESANPFGGDVYNRSHTFTGAPSIVFGNQPVPSMQAQYKEDKAQHGAAYAAGGAATTAIMDVLAGKGGAKGAVRLAKGKGTAVEAPVEAPKPLAETPVNPSLPVPDNYDTRPATPVQAPVTKPVETPALQPVAPAPVETPVTPGKPFKANTGSSEIDDAIDRMHAHYGSSLEAPDGAGNILDSMRGMAAAGQQAARLLGRALTKNLTKEERQAMTDYLEGVENTELTPRAKKVADNLKPLLAKGYGVRSAIDPTINAVQHYTPRIMRSSLKNALSTARAGTKNKLAALMNLNDLTSPFSKSRMQGKFVGSDGSTLYGHPGKLGIIHHEDGTYSNGKTGKAQVTYKPAWTDTRQLEANTGLDYLHDVSPTHSIYHADTARIQAKAAALNELTTNPLQHGLLTEEQVASGQYGGGYKQVAVPGLKDANGNPLWANVKVAKQFERDGMLGHPDARSLPGKVYDAFSNIATKFIVLNPIFHGANQLVQTAIAAGNMPGMGPGWARVIHAAFNVSDDDIYAYLKKTGHSPSYGSEVQDMLSRATFGISKLPSKLMAGIELKLRVSVFKASVDSGMDPIEAVKNIDKFLGDQHQLSRSTQRVTLFGHYFKTMTGALYDQARHPVQNAGANANAIAVAAILVGVNYEYQKWLGNKNAYVRMPGEIGMAKEIYATGRDLANGKIKADLDKGKLPAIVGNRVNPVAKEIVQQGTNHDMFTGKAVTDTGRGSHVVGSLIAPAQQVNYASSGKRSGAELVENQLGAYSPHAKGNVATTNPKLQFLNTPGAKVAEGNDPTGHAQQTAFFDTTDAAKKGLSAADQKLYDDMSTGTSKLDDKQLQAHYATMSANADVLNRIVKQKQDYAKSTGTPLDPLYSDKYTPEQRAEYFHMLSLPYKGDDYAQQSDANGNSKDSNGWMWQLTRARNDYFDKLEASGIGSNTSAAERVKPPSFDKQTEDDLNSAGALSGAEKAQFIADHPNVSQAYDALAKYTNDKRIAQGNAPFAAYPKPDAETEAAIKTYNDLPKHDGKKGGNATRAKWIQAHPATYQKIQDYYTKTSAYQLATNAGAAKYDGAGLNQTALKAAYDLGQYDIVKNDDGTYSLGSSGSSGSSSSSKSFASSYNGSSSSANYYATHASQIDVHSVSTKRSQFKKAQVTTANTSKARVKRKASFSKPSVSIKRSKV